MSTTFLACSSHPPLLLIRPREPAEEPLFLKHRAECLARIEAFDPEQVIFFGNNHFAGFHYSLMPPFCVGLAADAVDDLGGYAGRLNVPKDDAMSLLVHLRDAGFDPAVSYRMKVDHAFSQPLVLLTGGLDRYAVIPLFISVFTPPFLSFRRSRLFGEAVGHYLAARGQRTLIMGSGGLSHHPVRYFPLMDDAPADVLAYQMDGDRGGPMDDEAWFTRFSTMHIEGAEMAANGQRTAKDMRLNPEFDRSALQTFATGDLASFDDVDGPELIARAGVGALEIHSWIAAVAAHRVVSGMTPMTSAYAPVVEYGTGFGMLYGGHGQG